MSVYIISCPICRKQYKLTPKDPSTLAQKTFSCPNCHYSTPFTTLIKDLPSAEPISPSAGLYMQQANQTVHAPTKVSPNMSTQLRAYLTIVGSNSKFVINQGVYVLGRRSSDSKATLQLAPDISMSRQHARLAVQLVGGKLMAQLVGLKADNPVIINGKAYTAGKPCTLKSGDKLQLGQTRMVFTI